MFSRGRCKPCLGVAASKAALQKCSWGIQVDNKVIRSHRGLWLRWQEHNMSREGTVPSA